MNILQSNNKTRREFIKTCLRFGVGGGLLFTGIVVGTRKKFVSKNNDLCQLSTPCRGCSKYSGCNLPQALVEKKGVEQGGVESGRQ